MKKLKRFSTGRVETRAPGVAMPELYMLTVPGLQVKSDWSAVHDRLLDGFPQITDVLATTMTGTLLIAYRGEADVDAWLGGVSEAVLTRRLTAGLRRPA